MQNSLEGDFLESFGECGGHPRELPRTARQYHVQPFTSNTVMSINDLSETWRAECSENAEGVQKALAQGVGSRRLQGAPCLLLIPRLPKT